MLRAPTPGTSPNKAASQPIATTKKSNTAQPSVQKFQNQLATRFISSSSENRYKKTSSSRRNHRSTSEPAVCEQASVCVRARRRVCYMGTHVHILVRTHVCVSVCARVSVSLAIPRSVMNMYLSLSPSLAPS